MVTTWCGLNGSVRAPAHELVPGKGSRRLGRAEWIRRCDPGPHACLPICLERAAIATPRAETGDCQNPVLFTGCLGDTHEAACEHREYQWPRAIRLLLLLPQYHRQGQ